MSLLYSTTFRYPDEELGKIQEFSNLNHYHYHQQQSLHNSGLARYRSAPSSFLESIISGATDNHGANGSDIGGVGCEDYRYFRSSSPEMDTILARLMSPSNGADDSKSHESKEFGERTRMKIEGADSPIVHQNLPVHNLVNEKSLGVGNSLDSTFSVMNSMGLENSIQTTKMSTANASNLARQNSSPAGLFSDLGVHNGFAVVRDGNFRACNGTNGQASPPTSRLSNHVNFSSGQKILPQIAEIGDEDIGGNALDRSGCKRQYMANFSNDSWDHKSLNDFKRARDNDGGISSALNALDNQSGNTRNRVNGLTHHLSLPKTVSEMATVEKFLQFQGSVPCKIRAKRGCATHPRSIAERVCVQFSTISFPDMQITFLCLQVCLPACVFQVRRTRISERMRKLQELFPNMDKQTNTADMLDLAVEHIKDLQKQVKTLTDTRAKCTCSSKPKQSSNPAS